MVITLKINLCYIDDGWDHKLESAVWFWFSAWLDFRSLERLVWHPSGCVWVFSEKMSWCGKTYPAGGGNTQWAQGLDAVRAGAGVGGQQPGVWRHLPHPFIATVICPSVWWGKNMEGAFWNYEAQKASPLISGLCQVDGKNVSNTARKHPSVIRLHGLWRTCDII